jgi:1,4-dihydroxy-6-naphthoate synthase
MYTLGFSPCPNDCFIFDAMIHGKIDTEGLSFQPVISDVEDLNQRAFKGELDITKISYHAYAYINKEYALLHAGSALGNNCGPLLISKKDYSSMNEINNLDLSSFKIAIPGKFTTANLLMGLYAPDAKNKVELVFSAIEDSILNGDVDAGVIIHENRFTYQQKGLYKIIDLGEFWETLTSCPIPLGAITMKRNIADEEKEKINRVLRRSVEFAFANPESSMEFVKEHSQTMSEDVMKKHIDLYVNKYSIDLGETGKNAVRVLYQKAQEANIIPELKEDIFIEQQSTITH